MGEERYALTEEGRKTALGVVSSICHGFTLEQAAVLNGLEDEESVRLMLWLVLAEAGIVEGPPVDSTD